jgi:hypothetical protein
MEKRFYGWARAGGPLDNWKAELLNAALLEKINQTIGDLGDQIGNIEKIIQEKGAKLTDDEKAHLNSLISSLKSSIEKLREIIRQPDESEYPRPYLKNLYFAATLFDYWPHGYNDMRNHWEEFKNIAQTIANPKFAQYTWRDSLGEHSVRVEVEVKVYEPKKGDSIVPTVESYCEALCFKKCGDLKNYRGWVKVTVTHEDNPTEEQSKVNLAQRLLWRFLHPVVKSQAVVGYDFGPDQIKLLRQIF